MYIRVNVVMSIGSSNQAAREALEDAFGTGNISNLVVRTVSAGGGSDRVIAHVTYVHNVVDDVSAKNEVRRRLRRQFGTIGGLVGVHCMLIGIDAAPTILGRVLPDRPKVTAQ